jgi:hypothetical protein
MRWSPSARYESGKWRTSTSPTGGAFILTVALLHIVNSAAVPLTLWKSYSAYGP